MGDGFFSLTRAFNGYAEVDGETWQAGLADLLDWRITARYPDSRIQERTETAGGVTTVFGYTYDPFGRLLTVTRDGVLVEEYRYDAAGTREYEMNALRNIPGRSFTYSVEDHLYTAGDTAYDYDLDGFLTRKTEGDAVTGYRYSSRGELLRVDLPDGRVIEYIHDPLGRRIAKKIDGVITEKYLWSGRTTLLAIFDGSDHLRYRFEYADGRVPYAMTDGSGRIYYLAYDPVGSIRIIADATGNVVKRIDYDTFGNIIADTAPLFDIPFGFAGGLNDRDTGLVRFGFRDYDPDTGRWAAKDPIGFAGGDTDLYGYCLGDPINAEDADGLYMQFLQPAFDFAQGFFVPGPPPATHAGYAGMFARDQLEEIVDFDSIGDSMKKGASFAWESYYKEHINRNWRNDPQDPYYPNKNESGEYFLTAPPGESPNILLILPPYDGTILDPYMGLKYKESMCK